MGRRPCPFSNGSPLRGAVRVGMGITLAGLGRLSPLGQGIPVRRLDQRTPHASRQTPQLDDGTPLASASEALNAPLVAEAHRQRGTAADADGVRKRHVPRKPLSPEFQPYKVRVRRNA
jgi:hypothetical protein